SSQHSDDPLSGSGAKLSAPRKAVTPPITNAQAEQDYADEAEAPEPVDDDSSRRSVARLEAPRARELMPTRNEPAPDRPLLKRPASSTLR
ncbi:MAG: hypothetical protein AAGA69_07465, partial [Pseudomonadota bacterium]